MPYDNTYKEQVYATWFDYQRITSNGSVEEVLAYKAEVQELQSSHMASPAFWGDTRANLMYQHTGLSGGVVSRDSRGARPAL